MRVVGAGNVTNPILERLPLEIIVFHLLPYFNVREYATHLQRINKGWYNLFKWDYIWRNRSGGEILGREDYVDLVQKRHLCSLCKNVPHIPLCLPCQRSDIHSACWRLTREEAEKLFRGKPWCGELISAIETKAIEKETSVFYTTTNMFEAARKGQFEKEFYKVICTFWKVNKMYRKITRERGSFIFPDELLWKQQQHYDLNKRIQSL